MLGQAPNLQVPSAYFSSTEKSFWLKLRSLIQEGCMLHEHNSQKKSLQKRILHQMHDFCIRCEISASDARFLHLTQKREYVFAFGVVGGKSQCE